MNVSKDGISWYYRGGGNLVVVGIATDGASGSSMVTDKELFASPVKSTCPFCGQHQYMSWEFDAYFCPNCNLWMEEKCSRPNCHYCASRPENPLD